MQSLPMAYSVPTAPGRGKVSPGHSHGARQSWGAVGGGPGGHPAPLTLLVAQLLVLGLLASLQLVGVSVDGFEDGLRYLLLPPLGDGEREVAVQLLVTLQQLVGREAGRNRQSGAACHPCPPTAQPLRPGTLMPFVSSSSKEPMSKASAAFTSPRGGIRGGGYCRRERGFRGVAARAPVPLPMPCYRVPHLLQENHLPVQALEEGLLLHLLSPGERGGVSAAGSWLQPRGRGAAPARPPSLPFCPSPVHHPGAHQDSPTPHAAQPPVDISLQQPLEQGAQLGGEGVWQLDSLQEKAWSLTS